MAASDPDRGAHRQAREARTIVIVEVDETVKIFTNPRHSLTVDDASGRFG